MTKNLNEFETKLVQRLTPVTPFDIQKQFILFLIISTLVVLISLFITGIRHDFTIAAYDLSFLSSVAINILFSFFYVITTFKLVIPGQIENKLTSTLLGIFLFSLTFLFYSVEPIIGNSISSSKIVLWRESTSLNCTFLSLATSLPILGFFVWKMSKLANINTKTASFWISLSAVNIGAISSCLHCHTEAFSHRLYQHGLFLIVAIFATWPLSFFLLSYFSNKKEQMMKSKFKTEL